LNCDIYGDCVPSFIGHHQYVCEPFYLTNQTFFDTFAAFPSTHADCHLFKVHSGNPRACHFKTSSQQFGEGFANYQAVLFEHVE
jgi:hypothetical protein